MPEENRDKLILLGAGNLAWHLGTALKHAGYELIQVFSRSEGSAGRLAGRLGVEWTTDPGQLDREAGTIVFCVTDRAIPDLLQRLEFTGNPMLIHTAGSVPSDVFRGIASDYGVLYPLMTFSKERMVDFRTIPVCIEGNTPESLAELERMAGRITNRVLRVDSEDRKILHLAAIIASNFSNHMYHLSKDLLQTRGMDFSLLHPLIRETASKALEMDPASAQTGPASRNDREVILEHIDLLKGHPELQKLYTFVSDSITNHFRTS